MYELNIELKMLWNVKFEAFFTGYSKDGKYDNYEESNNWLGCKTALHSFNHGIKISSVFNPVSICHTIDHLPCDCKVIDFEWLKGHYNCYMQFFNDLKFFAFNNHIPINLTVSFRA